MADEIEKLFQGQRKTLFRNTIPITFGTAKIKDMTSSELLEEVGKITRHNLELIRKKFSHLSAEQKTWSPSENAWNIQEVFAHLNEYARFYHENFLRKIARTRFTTPKENFVSSPLGRSAWSSMKLGNARNVKRKFKAARNYNPRLEPQLVDGNDIERFRAGQEELIGILEKARGVNIRKAKVPLSMSKLIKLRLGDALLFVAYHNERHMQQAINIITHPQFPKK